MDLREIFPIIKNELDLVEQEISNNITSDVKLISTICQHILGSGGKRLRPALLLLTSKLLGNESYNSILLSVAVEFIHTATLLHDDVVDNSNLRRGKKSANSIWGNEASVLVGDFLFAKAFSLMVRCNNINILKIMAKATEELAEGEIFELVKTGDMQTAKDDYFKIITKKTAILFAASCEASGLLANETTENIENLRLYGLNTGIAFQLVDDILDYTSTNEEFGKKIGIDIEEGKVTYPLILALENSNEKEYNKIKEIFYKDELSKEDISFLRNFVIEKEGTEKALSEARKIIDKAKNCINDFSNEELKIYLFKLADFIIGRRF
jgi:octaprenyl-diphosphate synthase